MNDLSVYHVTVKCPATVIAHLSVAATSEKEAEAIAVQSVGSAPGYWGEPEVHCEQATIHSASQTRLIELARNHAPTILMVKVPVYRGFYRTAIYVVKGDWHELVIGTDGTDTQGRARLSDAADALSSILGAPIQHVRQAAAPAAVWDWEDLTKILNADVRNVAPYVICSDRGAQTPDEVWYWNEQLGWVGLENAQTYQESDIANVTLPSEGKTDALWAIHPQAFPGVDRATQDTLEDELKCFCFIERLPFIDAYELFSSGLNERQSNWLEGFMNRWSEVVA